MLPGLTERELAQKRLAEARVSLRASLDGASPHLAFVAAAGARLIACADAEGAIALLPELTVPRLADWCLVDIAGRDNQLTCAALAHAEPGGAALARAFRACAGATAGKLPAEPLLVADLGADEALEAAVPHAGQARAIRRSGARSLIRVALRARGRVLGAMTLLRGSVGPAFEASDLALAVDLAWRAALAIDNDSLHREAKEAVGIRDRVLSMVSHDLQNPLQVIELNAQLLREPADDRQASLDRMGRAALRMRALLRELIDVAAVREGRPLALDLARTDLVALVADLVGELRQEWPDRVIRLDASVPSLSGVWDRHRIERVVANLLSNAAKYSRPGGLIRVAVARLPAGRAGARAVVTVADAGVGIAAGDLPFVFELFRRGRNAGQRGAGSGIGLASAHEVVAQHGGKLTVESREGVGSTFTVSLPLDA